MQIRLIELIVIDVICLLSDCANPTNSACLLFFHDLVNLSVVLAYIFFMAQERKNAHERERERELVDVF